MKISNDELSTKAYKKVKEMIIGGKLKPGEKIVQDKLAEELGISRTPLRTALQILETQYLVEFLPKKGMAVKVFTNQEIGEVYDCRIALESMAVKCFTQVASESDIEKVSALFAPFLSDKEIDIKKYQQADSIFHDMILQKSGNDFLYKLFQKGNLLLCFDLIGLVRPPKETLAEHMSIIEAIKRRDANSAVNLMCQHLEKSKKLILAKD